MSAEVTLVVRNPANGHQITVVKHEQHIPEVAYEGYSRQRGKQCHGVTKAGTRCKHRWHTADPSLARKPYYCEQHQDQRPR